MSSPKDDLRDDLRDDRDLREIFAALRRDEYARLRPFRQVLVSEPIGRARQHRVAVSLAALATCVIVTLAAIAGRLVLVADSDESAGSETLSLPAWTSPTAFLLHTPGYELLTTVPLFGRSAPAPSADAPALAPPAPTTTRERNRSS